MHAKSPSLEPKQGLSAACANGCLVAAIVIPVAVVAAWGLGAWDGLAMVRLAPPDIIHELPNPIAPWQRAAGAAICLVPASILSFGLLRARRSLAAFARGNFFDVEVVGGLRDYAAATFWAAIASLIATPVLSVAMTIANPPGHRELSLDFSGAQLLSLLSAGIVWTIASAMARAAQIARENEQFV